MFLVEKCKLPGLLSYPFKTIRNNRGYWKCNLGKSVAMCCPDGYLYRPYQGCVEHDGPTDPCPPNIYHEGACDSKPIFGNLTHYDQFVEGHGWLRRPCAPGTHYNPVDCACTFHAAYIPGSKGMLDDVLTKSYEIQLYLSCYIKEYYFQITLSVGIIRVTFAHSFICSNTDD